MSLVSLVYVSIAADSMTDGDVKDILDVAREFNGKNNITGMLLYRAPYFIQALEGEKSVVDPLFEKISQDERHRNVLLVFEDTIESRTFSQWSMGFNKITNEDLRDVEGLNDFLEGEKSISYFSDHPARATKLLESFKNRTYF